MIHMDFTNLSCILYNEYSVRWVTETLGSSGSHTSDILEVFVAALPILIHSVFLENFAGEPPFEWQSR